MKIILALDDDNGMMFNRRRQSQDVVLRKKIEEITRSSRLWMNAYSKEQFQDMEMDICVDEAFPDKAGKEDYCFVENMKLSSMAERAEEFVIFKWNRRYPADMRLDFLPWEEGFQCVVREEFPGKSHENITMEVWRKEGLTQKKD